MSVIFPLSNYEIKQVVLPSVYIAENGDINGERQIVQYLERRDGDDLLWTYYGGIRNGKANGIGTLCVYGVDNALIHKYRGIFLNNQLHTNGLYIDVNPRKAEKRKTMETAFECECKSC